MRRDCVGTEEAARLLLLVVTDHWRKTQKSFTEGKTGRGGLHESETKASDTLRGNVTKVLVCPCRLQDLLHM